MLKKDLLDINSLTKEDILSILEEGERMRDAVESGAKSLDALRDRSVATLFYENSTRTKNSFENAARFLGANVVSVSVGNSSVKKGETLIDTGMTLERIMTDAIVIRHEVAGAAKLLADNVKCHVLNAGDGLHAHPTQALLDFLTMKEIFGGFEGLEVAIIGDIKHSRVARSNIEGLKKLGANVRIFAPNTLMPQGIERTGVKIAESVEEACDNADVIMGLRIQLERQKKGLFPSVGEYVKYYGITKERVALAKKNAVVMHPAPVNRGVEIASDVIDSDKSYIYRQVTNGLAVRMAVLKMLIIGGER
jgi:aspartate carbamoyltransferase catalytic subunit